MQVRKWWIYRTREGGLALLRNDSRSDSFLSAIGLHRAFPLSGDIVSEAFLVFDMWTGSGRSWAYRESKFDLTTPIISARQLVFHKLNPPTALVAAVEAKRAEEVLFDQGW